MLRSIAALIVVLLSITLSVSAQEDQVHTVLPGDNLFRIAQQYGVDVDAIAQANAIVNTWRIYPGQQLIIPGIAPEIGEPVAQSTPLSLPEPVATPTEQPLTYITVARGQSLAGIARQYGMTVEQIAQLNNITNPDLIYIGQRLVVDGNGSPPVESGEPTAVPQIMNTVTHVVQPGETLVSISELYGVSFLEVAQANNIFDALYVRPGQEILIPGGSVLEGAEYSFINAPAAPSARLSATKEVIVDLSDSRAYAYENGKLVRNVLMSPGLPGTPTVQGSFTVLRKYVAQTMTGPGYYLPDVPYVMYFYAGYALHGTYWHNNFGQPMSHGCVNLPTPEAAWFYDFTEVGTPVFIQL
jgi:LysM repeat protein